MRSVEHEKADGNTVHPPEQRVQSELGAGNVVTRAGRRGRGTRGDTEECQRHSVATYQYCLIPDIYP